MIKDVLLVLLVIALVGTVFFGVRLNRQHEKSRSSVDATPASRRLRVSGRLTKYNR